MPRMYMKKNNPTWLRVNLPKQKGIGLIEVLIALVISAFALLGLAGLQIASLRYQKVAQFRSVASQSTADIADRMRANVVGASDGDYNTPTGDKLGYLPPETKCGTADDDDDCTPATAAAQDISNWRLALADTMAGGWGEVAGNIDDGFVITVYFKEPGKPTDASGSLDPNCRAAALDASTDKDVRCFQTTFLP